MPGWPLGFGLVLKLDGLVHDLPGFSIMYLNETFGAHFHTISLIYQELIAETAFRK